MRRTLVRWIARIVLAVHFLGAPTAGARGASTAPRVEDAPNVVVILWNDPAPERFGLPGKNRATPRLDALRAEGARFPNGVQVCARGRPAAAALLSGLLPHQTGAYTQMAGRNLDTATSLSGLLHARGYAGLHVGKLREGKAEAFGFERDLRNGVDDASKEVTAFLDEFAGKQPLFVWWAPDVGKGQGVEELDVELGRLLDALEAHGQRANTLFAFVTNGPPKEFEFTARECEAPRMRNPLTLVLEGRIAAEEHAERVSVLDLYASVLDYAGLPVPEGTQSRSLRPLLEGAAWPARPIAAEFFAQQATPGSKGGRELWRDLMALVILDGPWKYALFLDDIGVKIDHDTELVEIERSAGDQVLYDLEADPGEERDLFGDAGQAERLETLRASLLEWWRATGGPDFPLPFLSPRLGPPPKEPRPNIVLVIADDMDYEHLGFLGNERAQTPTLDELANSGVVFPVAYVPMSRCRPSLATLLSGRLPQQTGIYENSGTHTLTRRDSLPNLLKAAGYATYLGGKFWEGSHHSMGFTDPEKADSVFQVFVRQNQDELFEFIDRTHAERPFFVWWAPMLPHGPFNPPARFTKLFADAEIPVPERVEGDAKAYREAERTAYSMDAWLDEGLGQLCDKLRQTGELEDTLFVFLIDNGYVNGDPSKGTVFEKGLRTPVFFSWAKGIQGGRTRPELLYSADLYRTILDYAGVPAPEESAGASLRPVLEGKAEGLRDVLYGAAYSYKDHPGQRRIENDVYAVYARTERWKFVLYLRNLDPMNFLFFHEFAPFPTRQRGDRDLFDLQADPYERSNLAGDSSHAALMDELERGCLEWWRANGGGELELPGSPGEAPPRKRGGKNR